ncbi:hypothetical protein D3C75_1234000 [compost metagenome]
MEFRIEESELSVDLHMVVLLGSPHHLLSRILQLNLRQEVERLTGLTVSEVNVEILEVIPVI